MVRSKCNYFECWCSKKANPWHPTTFLTLYFPVLSSVNIDNSKKYNLTSADQSLEHYWNYFEIDPHRASRNYKRIDNLVFRIYSVFVSNKNRVIIRLHFFSLYCAHSLLCSQYGEFFSYLSRVPNKSFFF